MTLMSISLEQWVKMKVYKLNNGVFLTSNTSCFASNAEEKMRVYSIFVILRKVGRHRALWVFLRLFSLGASGQISHVLED